MAGIIRLVLTTSGRAAVTCLPGFARATRIPARRARSGQADAARRVEPNPAEATRRRLSRSSGGVGSVFSQRQPFGGEPAAIGREPLVQYVRGENAVDAEMTKVVAQLAPRPDEGHVDVIGHRNRPNPPLRVPAFFVD